MITTEISPAFEALLEYIKANRNFDFTGYKRSTLLRRVTKRMGSVGIDDYTSYTDYLEVHPDEFDLLFNTILINVTSFFRDPSAWQYLASEVIPLIADGKESNEPIRVWSAGCSSGEEPYTLAMILAGSLGFEQLRDRVKIYATDIDAEALAQARRSVYSARQVRDVPAPYLERYFDQLDDSYTFRKEFRRAVIYGRNDLLRDAPISKIDLLVCRNTLIYFNSDAQHGVLSRFKFALKDGGILFLGRSEVPLSISDALSVVSMKWRVFAKPASPADGRLPETTPADSQSDPEDMDNDAPMREAAFNFAPVALVVLDSNHLLTFANTRARELISLTPGDMRHPLQWVEHSYRPSELRDAIVQAETERQPVGLHDLPWPGGSGEIRSLDVNIVPLLGSGGGLMGVSISLMDVTHYKNVQLQAIAEAEQVSEELHSTNEELETTNEELQSTVEELETTNEELQSTNEELETLNEELQSTNEELRTLNDEVRARGEELGRLNVFLESIMAGMRGGVVVVDRDLHIDVWNVAAEELWGLRSDEVRGQDFLGLDIGLPVVQLMQPIQDCLAGETDVKRVTLAARNRRGKAFKCGVTCTPFGRNGQEVHGAILIMEPLESA